jgi:hypothetical protein
LLIFLLTGATLIITQELGQQILSELQRHAYVDVAPIISELNNQAAHQPPPRPPFVPGAAPAASAVPVTPAVDPVLYIDPVEGNSLRARRGRIKRDRTRNQGQLGWRLANASRSKLLKASAFAIT